MSNVFSSNPLVSVVVPAYNMERFLEATLRSALAQTFRDIEVVVVDDGSTDRTGAIADAFAAADPRVRVLHVQNGGVARARNIGIEAARGAWVAMLDADDVWHPDKIAAQVEDLSARKGSDWAASYVLSRGIDIDGRVIPAGRPIVAEGYMPARHLFAKFVGNGSALMVRRDVALAVGGYDPSWAERGLGGCEDLDFELKVARHWRFAAVPRYLVGYRGYPGNMSSNHPRMARAVVATVDHHLDGMPWLAPWARRLITADAHAYAYFLSLSAQSLADMARHMRVVAFYDPLIAARLLAVTLLKRLPMSIWYSIGPAPAPATNRRPFFDYHPDETRPMHAGRLRRRRIERLGDLDEARYAALPVRDAGRLAEGREMLRNGTG